MTTTADNSLVADKHAAMASRLGRGGYVACALFAGTVGVWTVSASLSSAVIASASFVVENNVKKIQHASGGVVSELKVRDGDRVAAGDLLVRFDETAARTNLQIIARQLDETSARISRLEAERDQAQHLAFPDQLIQRRSQRDVALLLAAETRLFEARAAARGGMRAQLVKRTMQMRSEIAGLTFQSSAKAREAEVNARELSAVRGLYQRNLVNVSRLSLLERDAALIDGSRGMLGAQIAQAESKIAETELQIVQIDEDLRSEVLRDLRESEARIAELSERHAAASDQFQRLDVRAPTSGFIHQLAINNTGSVVNPAEPIMLIVPSEERLHVEARIQPVDYDQLKLGQDVKIRIHAFNQRTTPEINGTVSRMAADVSRESQNGTTFYTIRIAVPPEELERIAPLQIKAGMQAEAFIRTGERTPSSYILKPLADQISRAFKER